MSLTSIGDQLTPGRPVEVTFEAETGTPSDQQEVLLIGHKDATSGSIAAYEVTEISNSGDLVAASGEVITKFGAGSELALMVLAAVRATQGGSVIPQLKCIPLESTDTGFGPSDEALTAALNVKAEFIVSPYDGNDETTRDKLKDHCTTVSGAQRVENDQYGSFGVVFNRSVDDPSTLPKADTQFLIGVWLRDNGTPDYSIGEMAAASAAKMAANESPFNPLDNVTILGIEEPEDLADHPTVGAGLESEAALEQGWTPLKVKPNGEVAFVRTVTMRRTVDADGVTDVTSYYDVQDFQVLYFWRKTLFTRFSQPDLKQTKASAATANLLKSEVIRLASLFEDQNMFQAVAQLSKQFQVERSSSDRHRFDVRTPVNVIPGLHVIATNVAASTQFDTLSI